MSLAKPTGAAGAGRARRRCGVVLLAVTLGWRVTPAGAADERTGPSWADFRKLEQELRDQRQLILQLMQSERQRYDMMMKLIEAGDRPAGDGPVAAPPAASPAALRPAAARPAAVDPAPKSREPSHGSITGTVRFAGGKAGPVYVFVRNVSAPPARGQSLEIKQEGKQFIPGTAVVQAGTTLSFPNLDGIFHNVFSNSPRNAFDLGTYRGGEPARTVTVSEPGVVVVQCNIHEEMRANVLVVPNRLYTLVRPDGSFRLDGVPSGRRRVVAWGPNLKAVQQTVEVGTDIARADFALQASGTKVLPNKLGQAYGSYE